MDDWSRVLSGRHPRWDLHCRRWGLARPGQVAALKADAGFRRTGRVDELGIKVLAYPNGNVVIVDGKHRVWAAFELGLPSLWGRVHTPAGLVFAGPLWFR